MFRLFVKKTASITTVIALLFSIFSSSFLGNLAFATIDATGNSVSGGNNSYVNLSNSGSYPVTFTFSGTLDAGDIVNIDVIDGSGTISSSGYTAAGTETGITILADVQSLVDGDLTFSGSVLTSGLVEVSTGITATGSKDTIVPTATVIYSTTGATNSPVIATLTGESESITVTNNSGALTKTFEVNGSFTFNYIDAAGNTGSTVATVNNITTVSPATVNLLSASNFVLLSKAAITNVSPSIITGNVGASPISGAAIAVSCPEVTGTIYSVDAAGPACKVTNDTLLTTAVSDMETAYADAAGRTIPTATELGAGEIGGLTITPGLYKWGTDVMISTDVTLSGSASDVWIFQIAGDLTIASATDVLLSGGAKASNIFWQVGGPTGATLNTTSVFNGTILSLKQIILRTGATLYGRALAQTQIVLEQSTVTGDADSDPDQFSFAAQTGKELSTEYTSSFTVTGMSTGSTASISGGQYMIGTGSYTSSTGTVNNGELITVKLTSSASYSTATSLTLTIGGVSSSFSVTTKAAPSSGGGGGGSPSSDYCPSGDTSASYYDGKCSDSTTSTGTISVGSGVTVEVIKNENKVTITTTTASGTTTTTFSKPGLALKSLSEIKFTDITSNWAKGYIERLVSRGIINNTEKYNPDNNLTRAEFLKIAFNAAGWNIGTGTTSIFKDVAPNVWYAPYVSLAVSRGIITSNNTNFRPNDTISRAEAAKIIVGIFGGNTANRKVTFTDVDESSDLAKYIETAKDLGFFSGQLINGKLKFRPNDSITRAEITKVVVNAFDL